jgi:phosphatidylinositol alpha-1,6-mannosyltransferase
VSPRRILALLPGLQDHGGIQQQNRLLCGVITDWGAEHNAALEVVSLRDPPHWRDERYLASRVIGCNGSRYRFGLRSGAAVARPYDLLIVGVADFGVLLAVPKLLRRRAPILTIVHGLEVWNPLPAVHRAALTHVDRILSVSDYTAREIVKRHGADANKIVVVPNPLDPQFVLAAEAFLAGGGETHASSVLCIARMNRIDAEKGIETLIRAVAQLAGRAPDLRCIIVGDGEDRLRLQRLADSLGVDGVVRFAGRVSDTELHSYLAGTEVLALPSRKEGFGIVFLEAMQYGKPVIGGAHGGTPEVIADGVNGLLVEYGNIPGLAASLEQLLTDEPRRRAMGDAGRLMVREQFNHDRFRISIETLLDELLPSQ